MTRVSAAAAGSLVGEARVPRSGLGPRCAAWASLAALAGAVAVVGGWSGGQAAPTDRPAAEGPRGVAATGSVGAMPDYTKLSLSLVRNVGQSDPRVRYQAQAGGVSFFFTERKAVLAFAGETQGTFAGVLKAPELGDSAAGVFDGVGRSSGYALALRFRGASPEVELSAHRGALGRVSYMRGDDPTTWQQGLASFGQLTYSSLWPGIDMRLRGEQGTLKYEFALSSGADASRIGLAYAGAQSLSLAPDGGLLIETPRGTLRDSAPVAFQSIDGRRVPVKSRFTLQGATGYGFVLGAHDRSRPIVIDPGIQYSTFLGGAGTDLAYGVAVDGSGAVYVTGHTRSTGFPTTAGAFDTTHTGGSEDVFVSKLAPDGSSFVYATYLGGTNSDSGAEVAIDAQVRPT